MAKPTNLPEFDTNETDVVATDAARKADGFIVTASVPEKPSYKLFNYLLNQYYKWLKYFSEREQSVTHDIASDANYTLTAAQNNYGRVVITDTGVLLTAARNIIVDDVARRFIAVNNTLQTLTFKTSAGTGIAVKPGRTVTLFVDGTNVVLANNSYPSLKAYVGAAQNILDSVYTKINMDTEVYDTHGYFNTVTKSFTPLVAGKYRTTLNLVGTCDTANQRIDALIFKNGANAAQNVNRHTTTSAGAFLGISVSSVIEMNGTTDYIEAYGFTVLSNWGLSVGETASFITIERIKED